MKKDSTTKFILLIMAVVLVAASVYAFRDVFLNRSGGPGSDFAKVNSTESAPYTDLQGNPVDLTQYEGDVLVVNAWATWCPFCVEELPDLNTLAEEYRDQDVHVLAINRKESAKTAQAFVEHVGDPEYITFLLDPQDRFYKSIGGFSMPETVFYDREGNISFHKRGFMELPEMRQHLEKALQEKPE